MTSRLMNLDCEMISMMVGKKEICKVHQTIFVQNTVFRRSLRGPWTRSKKKKNTFQLEKSDLPGFGVYVHYLYSGNLPTGLSDLKLAKGYVFGDKYLDVKFKNVVMEAYIGLSRSRLGPNGPRNRPSVELVEFIYNNTHENTAFRRALVSLWTIPWNSRPTAWADRLRFYPQEFFEDVVKRLAEHYIDVHRQVVQQGRGIQAWDSAMGDFLNLPMANYREEVPQSPERDD